MWAIEDFLQTLLIIISLLMKFKSTEVKLILCPNLFITLVISTFFILKEIDGFKPKRSSMDILCIIIFTPFPVCFIVFLLLCAMPNTFFRAYVNYEYAMDQYTYPDTYKSQPEISKYLFATKHTQNELKLKILAINYYLITFAKEKHTELDAIHNDIEYEYQNNIPLMEFIANKYVSVFGSYVSTMDNIKWSDIRALSVNRTSFHLLFAFGVSVFIFIYKMYFFGLISYIWIYELHVEQKKDWFILLCLILYYVLTVFSIIRLWRLLTTSYVMFHIVAPLFDIEDLIYKEDGKNYHERIKDMILIIDEIYEIFCAKSALSVFHQNGILMDICDIIMQYSIYPIPINGTIDDIERVLSEFDADRLD